MVPMEIAPVPQDSSRDRGRRRTGIAAVCCAVLALVALAVPVVEGVRVASRPEVALGNGPEQVTLPAHAKYGLFFDDLDNSGYEEDCSATDHGRPVRLSSPGFSTSSSDTENLDLVFDTGSGHLVIDCSTTAENLSTKPVPRYRVILIAGVAAAALGFASLVLGSLWIARRPARHPEHRPAQA